MKIDIYTHIFPEKYKKAFLEKLKPGDNFKSPPISRNHAVSDIDMRLRLMSRYPDVLQVLIISNRPLAAFFTPNDAAELARIGNDELAELGAKYPDKFIAAVACLPLDDMDAALEETDRAITQLKCRGVEISTHVNGEPLDIETFRPLFEKMVNYDLPIWIHPSVYKQPSEGVFGWPYETASTMLHLVSSGIFNDYPDIKFIIHHCGSMAPFFEGRIRWLLPNSLGVGHSVHDPVEHFRKFYADTAVYGTASALMCGYDFFGADHLLFGTDAPMGPGNGLTEGTIRCVERMEIPSIEKEKIFRQNAIRLLKVAI